MSQRTPITFYFFINAGRKVRRCSFTETPRWLLVFEREHPRCGQKHHCSFTTPDRARKLSRRENKKKRKTELRTVLSDRWSSVTVTREDMLDTTHALRNGKLTIPRKLSPFIMGSEILLKQTIIFIFRFLLSVYWIV